MAGVASRSFAPVVAPGATVLVLGSLPGRRSLEEQQYYAQPQNSFWRILAGLTGADASSAYELRLAALSGAGIALWDVCAAAERPGSLDAAIRPETVVPNDLGGLLARYPTIGLVCFNGLTAATLYRRRVQPALPAAAGALPQVVLPSTSPAHASLTREAKRRQWHAALAPHLQTRR
jgi:hypoxanthine-DNA glycosylase